MRDDPGNASPERERRARQWAFIGAVLVAIAWTIYRPDRARPFHILDNAEFIPLLDTGAGLFDRTGSLLEYYGGQGRFNPIPYALLALKWDWFGWWSPGWQVSRAVLMIGVFALAYALLRRIGTSPVGGLIGASVFLWAPSASDGWVRMTMAEPLALAIALAMSIRAARFQATERWPRECVILGIGVIALILTKELVAPVLVLPVVLAFTMQPDGRFGLPTRSRRNLALFATLVLATVVAITPVAAIYLSADSSSYASLYGRNLQSPFALLAIWMSGLVPFDLIVAQVTVGWLLAIIGFTILLAAGWRIGFQRDGHRTRALLWLALVVPLIGVAAYTPNPWFARFYMLPYLVGVALLTGLGATHLERVGRRGRVVAILAWVGMSAFAISSAAELAARTDAVQRRDDRVISFVADSAADADTVVFATSQLARPELLAEASPTGAPRGLGATLRRFAFASHRRWPPTREASCDDGRRALAQSRGVVVLNLEDTCELGAEASHHIVQRFKRFDWSRLGWVSDSSQARVFRSDSTIGSLR